MDRLPRLADERVGLKVDLIATTATPPALAAKDATKTIPIVGISFDNPLQHSLVASLARPGGNVTGLSYSVGPEIFGKDLELLKELLPELRHIAVLSNSTGPNHAPMISNIKTAASSLGVRLLIWTCASQTSLTLRSRRWSRIAWQDYLSLETRCSPSIEPD